MKFILVVSIVFVSAALSFATDSKATFFLDSVPTEPVAAERIPDDFFPPEDQTNFEKSSVEMMFDCVLYTKLQSAETFKEVLQSALRLYVAKDKAMFERDLYGLPFEVSILHDELIEMRRKIYQSHNNEGEMIRYRLLESDDLSETDSLVLDTIYLDAVSGELEVTRFRTRHENSKRERGLTSEEYSCVRVQ